MYRERTDIQVRPDLRQGTFFGIKTVGVIGSWSLVITASEKSISTMLLDAPPTRQLTVDRLKASM